MMSSNYETMIEHKKTKKKFSEQTMNNSMITSKEIFIILCGFVLSRGDFTSYLMPFGYPFFAFILYSNRKRWWLGLSMLLGVATKGQAIYIYHHALVFALMFFGYMKIHCKINKKWQMGVFTCLCTTLIGIMINIFTGNYLFDYALSVLEGLVTFSLYYIYDTAMNLFINRNRKIYSNQEIICLGIFVSILILGLNDLIIYNFSMSVILSIFLILLFSYEIGISVSAPLGMTLGLILNLSISSNPLLIAIYGLCGLISGLFKEAGKIFVILGFIVSNAMITFYFNGSTEVYIHIEEIAIASLFFFLIPQKLWEKVNFFNFDKVHEDYQRFCKERLNENIRLKVNQYALLLKELGITFLDDGQEYENDQLYVKAMENAIDKTCANCYLMSKCWKTDGENTFDMVKETLTAFEKGEYQYEKNYLKSKCVYDDKMLELLKCESEYISLQKNINQRIHNNNTLVAKQLQYTGELLNSLKNNINDEWLIKSEEEKDILIEFDKQEISVERIFVIQENNRRYKITVICDRCSDEVLCTQKIPAIITDILHVKIVLHTKVCSFGSECLCKLVYSELAPYRITTGIIRHGRKSEENCGDIFSDRILENGNRILALGDGMGTGDDAYKESEPTINLLEKFMEAEIDKTIMVKTINSILMLRNERETFSTLDFVVFDQHLGIAEFNKIGAAITLVIQDDEVKLIRGQSLPVGIIQEIKIETVQMQLHEGDCIVMMTDGIFECSDSPDSVEAWIINTIKKITTRNPQKIADELFRHFSNICPQPQDDITILVGKVWKK
ncbi:MAG: stage II sporulation protein E [Eubacteriales bacterium]